MQMKWIAPSRETCAQAPSVSPRNARKASSLRPDLESRYQAMQTPSLLDRQREFADDDSDLPSYEAGGKRYVDGRHFVVLQKVEFTEIIPEHMRHRYTAPVILVPKFAAGIEGLGKTIHSLMPYHRRIATVLEIASTAQAVAHFLQEAPEIRRGRPPRGAR